MGEFVLQKGKVLHFALMMSLVTDGLGYSRACGQKGHGGATHVIPNARQTISGEFI